MENIDKVDSQRTVEIMYSKTNVSKMIRKDILDTAGIEIYITKGIQLLNDWIETRYTMYESKKIRLNHLAQQDYREIVLQVIGTTMMFQTPTLFTNAVGILTETLGYTRKPDGVKTIAEVLAVLEPVGFYTIWKDNKWDSLQMVFNFAMSSQLEKFINQVKYLPPMICEPRTVKSNYDSGYLTKKDSLILGTGNFHTEEICLDSINKFNSIPLSLDVELLKTYSEEPSDKIKSDVNKLAQWNSMVKDSYRVYKDLVQQGNRFYLTHKVDKRGRTYSQGYHLSTQANSFRKAIIDLAEKEMIEGFI